jgi:hypothetical protein
MTQRTSGGNTKNGVTVSQARRHDCTIVGYFVPQGPAANVSSSASAAVSLEAV